MKKSVDSELKRDATVSKEARQAMTAQVEQLSKDAKALRRRVKDGVGRPADRLQLVASAYRTAWPATSSR